MEGDDYGKKYEKRESDLVDEGFDIADFRRLHALERSEKRGDEEPSAVERGKREEVERAQIDGKERRDGKDDRNSDVGRNQLDEEASDGDGSPDAFGRLGALGGRLGHYKLTEEFEEQLEREGDLVDGLLPRDDHGLSERILVFEPFPRFDVGIRNVRSDLAVFGHDRHVQRSSVTGEADLHAVRIAGMGPDGFYETLGSRDFAAFDRNDPVSLEDSRLLRRTAFDGRNRNSGHFEHSELHRPIETRDEQGFGTGFEFRIHGERRDPLPEQSDENEEREEEIECDAREDDERFGKIRFRSERVLVGGGRTEFVFALKPHEPSDGKVVEGVFTPLRIFGDDGRFGRNAHAELLYLHSDLPRGEEMAEFVENDHGEKDREGDDDTEKYVHVGEGYESERDPLSGIPLRKTDADGELSRVCHLGLDVVEEVVDEVREKLEVFALGSEIAAVGLNSEAAVEFALLVFFEHEGETDFLVVLRVALEVRIELAGNVGFDETVDGLVVFGLDFLEVLLNLEFHSNGD